MRRLFSLLLVLTSVLFFQCQKEVSYVGGPDPVIVPPAPITAHLQGNVYDENNQPASGVTIRVGSKTAITDANGYFRITQASLDKNASLVTADKSGYFKAYRTFSATSGVNQVAIKLIPRQLAGTVDAATGGEASLSNGSKVALLPNSIVTASSGASYSGPVKVYAAYIDPTSAEIDRIVPGSFMANDRNGSRVTMISYGMVAVELEGSAGEKLQIKSGSKATLTTAIPASIQASAPASIATWSVDEQTGLWKEEGTAAKTGSAYVGEVSHFSFWNCDVGVPAINLSLTVQNSAGLPIVHALVKITRVNPTTNWGAQSYGWTDTLGQVSGLVPSNEALVLSVVDMCGNAFYTQNIGPFTQNTNLGVITVANTGTAVVTISGTVVNCSGAPVTNGYAMILYNNMVRFAAVDANGAFSKTIITCPSTTITNYQVIGVDATANQQGAAVTGTISVPTTNVGNVQACGISSLQYINYTFDGTSYSIANPATDSLTAFTGALQGTTLLQTLISGFSSGASIAFRFNHPTPAAGTYQMTMLQVNNTIAGNSTTPLTPTVVVTNFPVAVGDYYEGTFSGTYSDNQAVSHVISGNFRLRKNW